MENDGPSGRWRLVTGPAASERCRWTLPGAVRETSFGSHWFIERPVHEVWSAATRQIACAADRVPLPNEPTRAAEQFQAFGQAYPQRVIYLDLETCGFAGSMIFLAGLLCGDGQGWVLRQLWARDYSEEGALLWSLWECLRRFDVLVTFNGKSFDWPQIVDRTIWHRLPVNADRSPDANQAKQANLGGQVSACGGTPTSSELDGPWGPGTHFDLLHPARRRWKHQLPNCKLQTLEWHVLGRRRSADIRGREIPAAYHHYVRTGETSAVDRILHHNRLDLITLWQLSLRLLNERLAA